MAQRWRRIGWPCALLVITALSASAAEWSFSRPSGLPRNVKAAVFSDEEHGWVVCDRATIAFSKDGGVTWTPWTGLNSMLPPESMNSTLLDVFFVSPQTGWICGENGVLFDTKDGGQTWNRIPVVAKEAARRGARRRPSAEDGAAEEGQSGDASASPGRPVYGVLTDIFFLSTDVGWISGDGGLVLHTTDGGKSWTKQNTATNNALGGIYFLDEQQGIAVGDGGTILGTEDGGGRWRSRRSPTALSFQSLEFIGDEGWAVGSNGAAVYSADRGDTWELQESSVPNTNGMPEPIWNMDMATPMLGLAGAEFGVILRTVDGGKTWDPLDPRPTLNRVNDVAWSNETTAIAVGEYGTVLRTTDAGETWQTIFNNADLYSIQTVDAQTAWASGANGSLLTTNDGGANWDLRDIQVAFQLFDIAPAGRTGGIIIGDNHTFLETTDGGATWGPVIEPRGEGPPPEEPEERVETHDPSELALAWYAVDFADATHGWVAGDIGRALRTADGGQHWVSHTLGIQEVSPNSLFGVETVDGNTMVAVGAAGTIVRTTDGGQTWAGSDTGLFNELRAVEFSAGREVGWIVGGGGVILKTDDGGATWVEQQSNTVEKLHAVAVASTNEAWAVGETATVLHTTDGGVTWLRAEAFPVKKTDLFGVAAGEDGRAWACGEWGSIFVYE